VPASVTTAVSTDAARAQRLAEGRRPLSEYVSESGLQALVLGASKDPNAKVTTLLVSAQTGRPVLVAKAPLTAVAERSVKAEARLLRELGTLGWDRKFEAVPRVVELVEFERRTALVMTAVPGTPMTTSYFGWRHTRNPARVTADFTAAAKWLAALQAATAQGPAAVDMDGGIGARLADRFSEDEDLEADLDRLAEANGRLSSDTVPRTLVHGDFWCGNLLLEGGHITGVVDWEAGSTSGEPLRDLVRFALAYALYIDRGTKAGRAVAGHPGLVAGTWGAGIAYAIDGTGWFPELFQTFLKRGLERLGASVERWRDAALAGVAEVAALADDEAFARRHLELFRCLSRPEGLR
jgi:aminoglycoside phosphotransferase (APT) family kinase protein